MSNYAVELRGAIHVGVSTKVQPLLEEAIPEYIRMRISGEKDEYFRGAIIQARNYMQEHSLTMTRKAYELLEKFEESETPEGLAKLAELHKVGEKMTESFHSGLSRMVGERYPKATPEPESPEAIYAANLARSRERATTRKKGWIFQLILYSSSILLLIELYGKGYENI